MELRKYQNEYYVQIFYKNSVHNPVPIMIPGCGGTACALPKMYEIYDEIIPKNDFDTECLIPPTIQMATDWVMYYWIFILFIYLFLIINFGLLNAKSLNTKKKKLWTQFVEGNEKQTQN